MREAGFDEVVLKEARVGGQLNIEGATFKGKLNMSPISVGSNLLMGNEAEFNEVGLIGAKIGGQLSMDGSIFKDMLYHGLYLGRRQPDHEGARNSTSQPTLMFLSVGSGLDACGAATLRGLEPRRVQNQGRTAISDQIILGTLSNGEATKIRISPIPHAPKLTLRNGGTSVGALQDTKNTWPDHLEREFEGFRTYDRFGGFGASGPHRET